MPLTTCAKTRILVDDANHLTRLSLRESLESLGFAVSFVGDTNICLENQNPAIILVNLSSSTAITVDLLQNRHIRALLIQFHAAIVILSPGDSRLQTQCMAAGVADVLQMPLSRDTLYECICSL